MASQHVTQGPPPDNVTAEKSPHPEPCNPAPDSYGIPRGSAYPRAYQPMASPLMAMPHHGTINSAPSQGESKPPLQPCDPAPDSTTAYRDSCKQQSTMDAAGHSRAPDHPLREQLNRNVRDFIPHACFFGRDGILFANEGPLCAWVRIVDGVLIRVRQPEPDPSQPPSPGPSPRPEPVLCPEPYPRPEPPPPLPPYQQRPPCPAPQPPQPPLTPYMVPVFQHPGTTAPGPVVVQPVYNTFPLSRPVYETHTKYKLDGDFYRNQLVVSTVFLVCGVLCLNMFIVPCAVFACIKSMMAADAHEEKRLVEAQKLHRQAKCCNIAILVLSAVGVVVCSGIFTGVAQAYNNLQNNTS